MMNSFDDEIECNCHYSQVTDLSLLSPRAYQAAFLEVADS